MLMLINIFVQITIPGIRIATLKFWSDYKRTCVFRVMLLIFTVLYILVHQVIILLKKTVYYWFNLIRNVISIFFPETKRMDGKNCNYCERLAARARSSLDYELKKYICAEPLCFIKFQKELKTYYKFKYNALLLHGK